MTTLDLSRELDFVCRQFHVEPSELRFGRTRRRTAKLVTAARALFIVRAWKRGATGEQISDTLQISASSVWAWLREMRSRGLVQGRRIELQPPDALEAGCAEEPKHS